MGNSCPADEGRARTVSPTRAVIVVECAVARSGYGDEQAPRLAPEKRDFTATYTLGATMRQITYY